MSKKLLIVESPSKAKTISKYLGDEYEVLASVGHIRDLPKSNKKAIDIEGGFIPHYEISKGKEKVVADIKRHAGKASEVLLATDPDREGEAIAWHIAEAVNLKNPKRIVFNEITKDAILEALQNPRQIDDELRKAQEARRVLDRLVGYDLSGLIWKKVRYGLSAGRVQSPALRIVMEREREIRAFIPEKYWIISAEVKNAPNKELTLTYEKEPRVEEEVKRILEISKKGSWKVIDVKETETKRNARAPFTTSTLQQSASSRLGFSPSRTMGIAQKLYESGFITYMRTDSTNLSKGVQARIADMVASEYGKEYVEVKDFKTKSKNAQEAHEAIRPTDVHKKSLGHTPEQKKLYELIWERAVSSQMAPARILKTKITARVDDESILGFVANGGRTTFDGWLKVDKKSAGEDVELPKVKTGEKLTLLKIESDEKSTEPPARYTEAGLVKELEKRGIGRPSTYASIMKTLDDRGYTTKDGRALRPTDTGEVVSDFLENYFGKYISDSFTAEMENELDEIADGKREYEKTLSNFYKPFLQDVKEKEKEAQKITTLGDAPKEFPCPVCGAPMIIKLGRSGKFMSCSKFPDCSGGRTMDGEVMDGPKLTGEKCPECGTGELVERSGKYGKFIACNRYPKCRFVKENGENKQNGTGVKCPVCNKGEMVEKRGRFGVFYSCSNYPSCKNAIKAKPTGNICKMCGALMMEGTKTIPERCSNKACPNHRPDKLKE